MTTRNNNKQEQRQRQGRLLVGRFGRRAEAPNRTTKARNTGENARPVAVTDPSIRGHRRPEAGSRRPERGGRP